MDSPVALEIRVSDLTCALQEENSKLRTAFSMRNRLVQDHNRDTSHWAKKAILDLTSVIACLEATDSQLLSPIRLLSNRTADVCRISAILKRSYQNLRRCSEQAQNSFAKLDESTGKCLNAALSLDLKLTETTVSIQRIEVESKEIEDQVIRHLGHIVERAQNLQTRKSDSQQALSAMKKELVATTIEECKSLTKLGMYTFLALAFICSGETVTFLLGLLFMYLLVRSVREWYNSLICSIKLVCIHAHIRLSGTNCMQTIYFCGNRLASRISRIPAWTRIMPIYVLCEAKSTHS
jgi:hypothetical protein